MEEEIETELMTVVMKKNTMRIETKLRRARRKQIQQNTKNLQ